MITYRSIVLLLYSIQLLLNFHQLPSQRNLGVGVVSGWLLALTLTFILTLTAGLTSALTTPYCVLVGLLRWL